MSHHGGKTGAGLRRSAAVGGAVALLTAAGGVMAPAQAYTTLEYTQIPLTQQELEHWVVDRATPSGGYESLSYGGRDDVLEVRIDSANRSDGSSFRYTEGLKRDIGDLDAAKIDLFVDPDWLDNDKDVRAGFWGVGEDAAGAVSAYPIAEFTTNGAGGFVGWRVYDSSDGQWQQTDIPYTAGEWTTLEMVLDEADDEFELSIGGHATTSPAVGSTQLSDVIVNQYNYGTEGQDYDVHWSNFATGELGEKDPEAEITSPTAGETVTGTLDLAAWYADGDSVDDDAVQWAVRAGTCASNTGTTAGNVDGYSDDYAWDGAEFTASLDVRDYASGEYCFVFNPSQDTGEKDIRETVTFSIAKFSATTKDECKDGGWREFGADYPNQGTCIADAVSNQHSAHRR